MGKTRWLISAVNAESQVGQAVASAGGWKPPESVLPKGDIEFPINLIGGAELSLIRMFPWLLLSAERGEFGEFVAASFHMRSVAGIEAIIGLVFR